MSKSQCSYCNESETREYQVAGSGFALMEDGVIYFGSPAHIDSFGDVSEFSDSFSINYCPMCGEKLKGVSA